MTAIASPPSGRDLPDIAAHRERDPAAVRAPRRIERPRRHGRHQVTLFSVAVAVAIRAAAADDRFGEHGERPHDQSEPSQHFTIRHCAFYPPAPRSSAERDRHTAHRVSGDAEYTHVMKPSVNYDVVAPAYDQRYQRNRFEGIDAALRRFIGQSTSADVAEVGCGTGHWLAQLRDARTLAGVDLSPNMLLRARAAVPSALLVRGRAESLPWTTATFDRLFCINAVHHFDNAAAFMREARRVLRPGGGLLTVGREPPALRDEWWIYKYFPGALAADRERYLPTTTIREHLEAAGFTKLRPKSRSTSLSNYRSSLRPSEACSIAARRRN